MFHSTTTTTTTSETTPPSSQWNSYFQHHQDKTSTNNDESFSSSSSFIRRRIFGNCPPSSQVCFEKDYSDDEDEEYNDDDDDEYEYDGEEGSFVGGGDDMSNGQQQQQQQRRRWNYNSEESNGVGGGASALLALKKLNKPSQPQKSKDDNKKRKKRKIKLLSKQQRIKLRYKLAIFILFLYIASCFLINDSSSSSSSSWINAIKQQVYYYNGFDTNQKNEMVVPQAGEITMHETIGNVRKSRVHTLRKNSNNNPEENHNNNNNDVVNVLTLGGPITWGINLSSRKYAYPYLLASPSTATGSAITRRSVTNVALQRAEKSIQYASTCIQTMIHEGTGGSSSSSSKLLEEEEMEDPNFDVIVLEFSLAGLPSSHDLNLLLQRLRHRYPNAIIIYVHLWSLFMSIVDGESGLIPRNVPMSTMGSVEGGKEGDGEAQNVIPESKPMTREEQIKSIITNPSAHWVWDDTQMKINTNALQIAAEAIRNVKGHLYEFTIPESPLEAFEGEWFNGDNYHHLSPKGHEMVALGVEEIMQHAVSASSLTSAWRSEEMMQQPPVEQQRPEQQLPFVQQDIVGGGGIGTWGSGDQCHSWYETGISKLQHINGNIERFVTFPTKRFAHHIYASDGNGGAKIEFINKSNYVLPVKLVFMSWGEDGVYYPKSQITLISSSQEEGDGQVAVPNEGGVEGAENNSNAQTIMLNPMHPDPTMRQYHEPRSETVGYASPGKNILDIVPLEETEKPLRVVGLMMCGVCD